jgi:hypothetical protein
VILPDIGVAAGRCAITGRLIINKRKINKPEGGCKTGANGFPPCRRVNFLFIWKHLILYWQESIKALIEVLTLS